MSRIAAIFPLAVVLFAGAAQAQSPRFEQDDPLPTRKVSYSDLDLARAADVYVLQGRLSSAVGQVCRKSTDDSIQGYHAYGRCIAESMDAAVRRINAPLLTAMVDGRSSADARLHLAGR